MCTMCYRVMIHEPANLRSSWGCHAVPGYYVGPALNQCLCFTIFPTKTRTPRISDAIEFSHHYITVTHVAPEDKVINSITKLKQKLAIELSPNSSNHLTAIKQLKSLYSKCKGK